MPRSGTSLAAQILGTHSSVCAVGERADFKRLERVLPRELTPNAPFPQCCRNLTGRSVKKLSNQIAERLRRVCGASTRVVMKLPEDFANLGLIRILFPAAKIVHCVRDPIDTCLSCYMQNFDHIRYATNLQSLADYYLVYRGMMRHWQNVIPSSAIFELSYERLVTDVEATTAALFEFCGLTYEEEILRFHSHGGRCCTSSVWEVRKPIYTSSVNRSMRYREFLGPLLQLDSTDRTPAA